MRSEVTLYLAGPMRGYPRFNFDAFAKHAKELRDLGYRVISPAEMDIVYAFDPNVDEVPADISCFIRRDVEAILMSDGIVMMDGWEKSRGATAEKAVAEWAGKPVNYIRDILMWGGSVWSTKG